MALKKLQQVSVQKNELGEVVAVYDLKTIDSEQAKELKRQAIEYQARENAKRVSLENEINELKCELAKVKGELAYNRGDITKEEYEELCGLNK